jgi:hypothetical protein
MFISKSPYGCLIHILPGESAMSAMHKLAVDVQVYTISGKPARGCQHGCTIIKLHHQRYSQSRLVATGSELAVSCKGLLRSLGYAY